MDDDVCPNCNRKLVIDPNLEVAIEGNAAQPTVALIKCSCRHINAVKVTSAGNPEFRGKVDDLYGITVLLPATPVAVSSPDEINQLREKIKGLEQECSKEPSGNFFTPKYYRDDGVVVERLPVKKFKKHYKLMLTKELTTELFGKELSAGDKAKLLQKEEFHKLLSGKKLTELSGKPIKTFSNEARWTDAIDKKIRVLENEKKNYEKYVGLDKLIVKEDGSIKSFIDIMSDYAIKLFKIFSEEIFENQNRTKLSNGLIGDVDSPVHFFPEPHLFNTYEHYKFLIDLLSRNESVGGIVKNRFGLINEAIDVYDNPFYNSKTENTLKKARKLLKKEDVKIEEAFSAIAWQSLLDSEDSVVQAHLEPLLNEISRKIDNYNAIVSKIESLEAEKSGDLFNSSFYRVQARFLADSRLHGYRPPKDQRVSCLTRLSEDVPDPRRSIFDIKGTNLITTLVNDNPRPGDLNDVTKDLLNATANKLIKSDCQEGIVFSIYGKEPEVKFIEKSYLDYLSRIKSSADHLSNCFKEFFERELQDFESIESLIDNNIVHFHNLGINSWDRLLKFFRAYESIDLELEQQESPKVKSSQEYFKGFGTKSWTGSELTPFNRPPLKDRLEPLKKFGRKAWDYVLNALRIRKKEIKPDSVDELRAYCEGLADDKSIYLKLLRREPDNIKLYDHLDKVADKLPLGDLDSKDESSSDLTPELFNNLARKIPVQERFNKQNAFLRTFYVDRGNINKWYAASAITTGAGIVLPPVLIASVGLFSYAFSSKHMTDRTLPEVIDYNANLTLLSKLVLDNKPIHFLPHIYKEQTYESEKGV